MAFSSLTGYQIVIIIIVAFNFLFWVSIIVWRAMYMGGIVTASRRYLQGMRALVRSGTPAARSSPQSQRSLSINGAERGSQVNHPPPPYEEAIKYPCHPSISSLLSNSHIGISTAMATGNLNLGNASELAASQSSLENIGPGHERMSVTGCGVKKQLIRSFSCGDLENLPRASADFLSSPLHHPQTNH